MNIEAELPDEFDQFTDEEKVEELENLLGKIDDSNDSGKLKKRIIEELIRKYSD